jgi:hypothetical protein
MAELTASRVYLALIVYYGFYFDKFILVICWYCIYIIFVFQMADLLVILQSLGKRFICEISKVTRVVLYRLANQELDFYMIY